MRIRYGASLYLAIAGLAAGPAVSFAQSPEGAADAVEQQAGAATAAAESTVDAAADAAAEGAADAPQSFEDALDKIEEEGSSLLSDSEDAPYLFEYEYEYEYDSSYTTGFKPKSSGAAGGDSATTADAGGTDRIEAAGQKLVDASLLEPKSRVREQFVKLGGESLSIIGLHSLNDLVSTGARGLFIQPNEFSSSSLDLTLRGVSGTTVDQVTGESGVGVFIDGVPVLRGQAFGLGLLDLESMDMLRGSRGVVAGRNASGGALYMNTQKPSGEFGLRQRVRLGFAFDDVRTITNIDLPYVPGLPMTRVSYLTSQHDGWVENRPGVDANDFPYRDNTAWRVAMTTLPSDKLSLDLTLERSDLDSTHHYLQAFNAVPSEGIAVESGRADTVRAGSSIAVPLSRTKQTQVTLNSSYVVSEKSEFKTIVGWAELEDRNSVNFDGYLGPLVEGANSREGFENDVLYVEAQYNGKAYGDFLNYSLGIARTEDDSDYAGTTAVGSADLVSTSLYAQALLKLDDNLSLTLGYRSTEDEKDFNRTAYFIDPDIGNNLAAITAAAATTSPGLALQALNGTQLQAAIDTLPAALANTINPNGYDMGDREVFLDDSYDDFTIALDFEISKQLSAYASWSTGHKAGGASLFAEWRNDPSIDIYAPEKTETIQLGIKGNLLESKLYFDAALFSNDIDDRQLVLPNPSNRRLTNIVNANETTTINGFELDLRYKLNESIRLGGFLTLLDADDTTIPASYNGIGSGDQLLYQFNPNNPSVGAQPQRAFVERAPDTSVALTADVKFGLGQSRDSVFRLEYVNTSGYKFDTFSDFEDSRSLLNARLLFSGFELEGADDGKIEISIWGENLLDEEYVVNAVSVDRDPDGQRAPGATGLPFEAGAYGEPLTYGVDIDFVF